MINGPERNDHLRVDDMMRSVSDASLTSAGNKQRKIERNPFVRGVQNGLRSIKSSGYLSEGGEDTYGRRWTDLPTSHFSIYIGKIFAHITLI